MIVKQAKEIARQWIVEEESNLPGFAGAFYHGSINWLAGDTVLPESSDVDVMVICDGTTPSSKRGKFRYQGVLLEVSYLPLSQLASAEDVLTHYQIAGSFQKPGIILDSTGYLTTLQQAVSHDYAKQRWVQARCEHARNNVQNCLRQLHESSPLHDQVNAWSFGAGVTTHILLVAGLKNPTVRKRYLAVRELLEQYGFSEFYETLLDMLSCTHIRREQVELHLKAVADAFDTAKVVLKTPYPFAADLTDLARPVVIEGSQEMIEQGNHREAIFWMVATYSRCQWVLHHDASIEVQERFTIGYQHLLADLGIFSFDDLERRCELIRETLPRVWEVAEAIMAANPEIEK